MSSLLIPILEVARTGLWAAGPALSGTSATAKATERQYFRDTQATGRSSSVGGCSNRTRGCGLAAAVKARRFHSGQPPLVEVFQWRARRVPWLGN